MDMHIISMYFIWINSIAGFVIWQDWRYCRDHRGSEGAPESVLLLLSFAGGAFGIYAVQLLLNHRQHRAKYCIRTRLCMMMHSSMGIMFAPQWFPAIS